MLHLIAAAALSAASPAATPDASAFHDQARRVFADYAAACAADGGATWGRSLCGPVLAYDPDTGAVAANTADAEGRLAETDGLWTGRAGADDAPPHANTSADWAGTHWAVVRAGDLGDGAAPVRVALHESFHRIQPQLGLSVDQGPVNEHLDGRDGRLWLRLELRALSASIAADDPAAARAALADAAAFRAARYRAIPEAEAREAWLERHEGLAEYTGWRLAEADLDREAVLADIAWKEEQDSFARSFAYATGPALGLALDRLGAEWIPLLADNGLTFLDIAARFAGPDDPRARGEAAVVEVARGYGYDALLAEETARAEALAERRADYLRRFVEGPRLVTPMGYMSFDPGTVTTLGDHGQVYRTLKVEGDWGTVETSVGGLIAWNEGVVCFERRDPVETGTWTTDVWTLTLADGWRLEDDGRDLVVVPAE